MNRKRRGGGGGERRGQSGGRRSASDADRSSASEAGVSDDDWSQPFRTRKRARVRQQRSHRQPRRSPDIVSVREPHPSVSGSVSSAGASAGGVAAFAVGGGAGHFASPPVLGSVGRMAVGSPRTVRSRGSMAAAGGGSVGGAGEDSDVGVSTGAGAGAGAGANASVGPVPSAGAGAIAGAAALAAGALSGTRSMAAAHVPESSAVTANTEPPWSAAGGGVTKDPSTESFVKLVAYPSDVAPVSVTPDNLLAAFLHPVKPEAFRDAYFRRHPVVVQGGPAQRFQHMVSSHLCDLDLEALISASASDTTDCWMRALPQTGSAAGGTSSAQAPARGRIGTVRVTDPKAAVTLFEAGASLYFLSSQAMADEYVGAMNRDLHLSIAGHFPNGDVRGEVEVFASRKGHLTDWHFDFQENFTFQLSGEKKWFLKKSTVSHPLRGCTPHYKGTGNVEEQLKVHRMQNPKFEFKPTSFDDVTEITLQPGDVLYHPGGVWHRVEATEDSLSINLSIVATTWADIAADAVRQLLWRDNRYRGAFAAPAPSIARVRLGPMLASLRGALGALKPEHLLPDAHFDPPGTVVVASRDDAPRASTTITSSTMLKANPLVAVLRYSDVPRDSDGEEWEAVDGDGGAGAGETSLAGSVSGDDSRRGARHAGRSEGGGSDSDSGDVDTNAGSGAESEAPAGGPESLLPGHQGYVVHLNYGNERLESHMRTEIQVPDEVCPIMEWLLNRAWARPEGFTVATVCRACRLPQPEADDGASTGTGASSPVASSTRASSVGAGGRGSGSASGPTALTTGEMVARLFQVLLYCGVLSLP